MCRAIYLKNLKKSNKDMFAVTLNYAVNSHHKGNKDGYFVKFGERNLRTLDYKEFITFILDYKEEINNSEDLMLHLRMATHGDGEKYIHGWNFGAFTCYHNGVVEINNKKRHNDSMDFFKEVTSNNKVMKNIKREIKNRFGSGAFFMMGENESYIFSKNHSINIHLINEGLIAINSNDDIHLLEDEVEIEENIPQNVWGLEFNQTTRREIKTDFELISDRSLVMINSLMVINRDGVVKVMDLDVTSPSPYKSSTYYGGYSGKNYDEEKAWGKRFHSDEEEEKYYLQKYASEQNQKINNYIG